MEPHLPDNTNIQGIDSAHSFNLKCSYCSRNLSSRQNLKEHLYTHTGERPFKCEVHGCGKTFRQGSLYSIHKKTHQTREDPKEHKGRTKSIKLTDFSVESKPMNEDQIAKTVEEIGEGFRFIEKYLKTIF